MSCPSLDNTGRSSVARVGRKPTAAAQGQELVMRNVVVWLIPLSSMTFVLASCDGESGTGGDAAQVAFEDAAGGGVDAAVGFDMADQCSGVTCKSTKPCQTSTCDPATGQCVE